MLARFLAAAVCIVTQQPVTESASLIGSWNADDRRTYYEVHFRPDHTFTLFARMSAHNPTIAIAQMGEQIGTWHIAGDRVVLDSTEVSRLTRRFHLRLRFQLRDGSLRLQRFYDTARTDTYRRLHLPVCAELRSDAPAAVVGGKLVGRWRGHYRTHDTEFAFQPDRHVDFYSWDLGPRRKFLQATWRLRKNVVSMKAQDDWHITWHIRVGRRCMVVSDGSEMSYTLHRID